jgi:hypothetical protein
MNSKEISVKAPFILMASSIPFAILIFVMTQRSQKILFILVPPIKD